MDPVWVLVILDSIHQMGHVYLALLAVLLAPAIPLVLVAKQSTIYPVGLVILVLVAVLRAPAVRALLAPAAVLAT